MELNFKEKAMIAEALEYRKQSIRTRIADISRGRMQQAFDEGVIGEERCARRYGYKSIEEYRDAKALKQYKLDKYDEELLNIDMLINKLEVSI